MSSKTSDETTLHIDNHNPPSDPVEILQSLANKIDKTAEMSRTRESTATTLYQAVCVSGETNEMAGDAAGLSSARFVSVTPSNGDNPVSLRQVKFQIIKGAGDRSPTGWTTAIARHDDPRLTPYEQNVYRNLLPWCTSINEAVGTLPIKNGDIVNVTKRGGAYFYDSIAERSLLTSLENWVNTADSTNYGSNAFGESYSGGPNSTMGSFLPPSVPEGVSGKADSYDEDKTIPNKSQHAPFLKKAHPSIVLLIKAFIYECWAQQKTKIRLNSTYRSASDQQNLYDEWVAGGRQGVKPATPGYSWHNLGAAFDFNPKLKNGITLMKATDKQTWLNSNIPNIGESLGLRWGGHFKNNYDPIHFDLGNQYTSDDREKAMEIAKAMGMSANRVTLG